MTESKYINTYQDNNGADVMQIEEGGYINSSTYDRFKYIFAAGTDITESLNKSNKSNINAPNKKAGRIGYSPMTCHYPDNETSNHVMMEDCIVQYRDGMNKEGEAYGHSYVCIGFPEKYIDRIFHDAKKFSNLNLTIKDNKRLVNGYYWIDCNLDKLPKESIYISAPNGGGMNINIGKILMDMSSNLLVSTIVTVSASMTTADISTPLDLKGGTYHITIKPIEMFIKDETKIAGPTVTNLRRNKETVDLSSKKLMSSEALARYAMSKLTLGTK